MDHVQISLEEYHALKGDRDDYMDRLNCRIEKDAMEIEELKSAICIISVREMYVPGGIHHICKSEKQFCETAKKYIGDVDKLNSEINSLKERPNESTILTNDDSKSYAELKEEIEKLKADNNWSANTLFGKLAGLKHIY